MKEFTVERKKWARGNHEKKHGEDTCLLTSKGFMCCLGFYMNLVDGISKTKLIYISDPYNVFNGINIINKKAANCLLVKRNDDEIFRYANNALTINAMEINDNDKITDKQREKKLTELFKKHDIEVTFV